MWIQTQEIFKAETVGRVHARLTTKSVSYGETCIEAKWLQQNNYIIDDLHARGLEFEVNHRSVYREKLALACSTLSFFSIALLSETSGITCEHTLRFYLSRNYLVLWHPKVHHCKGTLLELVLNQSTSLHSIYWNIYFSIIVSCTHILQKWSLPLSSTDRSCVYPIVRALYLPRPSHRSRFNHPNNTRWRTEFTKLRVM
jgi:hypothetical protein